jgi:hypothetical protein
VVLGKYFQKPISTKILRLPKNLQALVATEDELFLNTQALTGGTLRAIASLGTSGATNASN